MTRLYREEIPDGKFHHRMTRTIGDVKLGFEWFGGAYIQVCKRESYESPQEVINVWDYASDSPRIPRTVNAMEARVSEWIKDYGIDNLVHDVTTNWR